MSTLLTTAILSNMITVLILLSVLSLTISVLWLHYSCCNLSNSCTMLALSVLKRRHPYVVKSDLGTTENSQELKNAGKSISGCVLAAITNLDISLGSSLMLASCLSIVNLVCAQCFAKVGNFSFFYCILY